MNGKSTIGRGTTRGFRRVIRKDGTGSVVATFTKLFILSFVDMAQLVSALAYGARCPRFKSGYLHHITGNFDCPTQVTSDYKNTRLSHTSNCLLPEFRMTKSRRWSCFPLAESAIK